MNARTIVIAVLLGAMLTGGLLSCRKADAVVESPQEKEAEQYLIDYLKIDTSNPPGNETEAAVYLQGILTKEGIESRLIGRDPKRQALYARLESGADAPALLLLHHTDVVPANPSEWSVQPFSGEKSGGYIWGRGALDIKSLGIAQLMAVLDLKRSGVPLTRDVIYLAVPDEEYGGMNGMKQLLDDYPQLFNDVGFVLNEGGANETAVDKVLAWGIEVDQKTPLWVLVRARGEPGHGALPPDDGGSIARLMEALTAIRAIPHPYRLTPTVARYFQALAPSKPGRKGEILAHPERHFGSPEFEQAIPASYRSLLRDTSVVTSISGGDSVNSLPLEATATVDLRLLPDTPAQPMLQALEKAVEGKAKIRPILVEKPAPASPVDTDLYRLLEAEFKRLHPTAVVVPMVSPGTTDSRFFRQRGVVAYGISPFKVNYYDADSIHGIDERIRARFFAEGVRLMRRIVRGFVAEQR